MNGNSDTKFEGALYFPTTKLKFKGGSAGASKYLIMVVKRIEFSGHAYLDNDYGGLAGGSPVKTDAVLAE